MDHEKYAPVLKGYAIPGTGVSLLQSGVGRMGMDKHCKQHHMNQRMQMAKEQHKKDCCTRMPSSATHTRSMAQTQESEIVKNIAPTTNNAKGENCSGCVRPRVHFSSECFSIGLLHEVTVTGLEHALVKRLKFLLRVCWELVGAPLTAKRVIKTVANANNCKQHSFNTT